MVGLGLRPRNHLDLTRRTDHADPRDQQDVQLIQNRKHPAQNRFIVEELTAHRISLLQRREKIRQRRSPQIELAQGLQHRLAGSGVQVCLVKPGPTRTPMTAHLLDSGLPLAEVSDVAEVIVRGVEKGRAVIYAPGKWALIMLVIRHLPRLVFNRLDI